ncbi:MAG: SDR family NAD(P)-dependent oxidoreductase [Acidobacteria bacterium]|nr:SDR family NAD(P)-dependent oxidoreductase [Acidobacteriota bacterium]
MAPQNTPTPRPLALITGASSGIGYELAKIFAKNGYDLFVTSGSEKINTVLEDFRSLGVQVMSAEVDLAEPEGADKLWREVAAADRNLDVAVINAGVGVGGRFDSETDLEEEINIVDLNCRSTVILAKYVVKHMRQRGAGKILFTASIAGTMPTPLEAVYGASKAFVLSFSNALHYELKDTGITVTALMPGATDTNFFHRAHMDDTKVGSEGKYENKPEDVAQQGYDALMSGDEKVVAVSVKTKIQGRMAPITPDPALAAMHEKMASKKTA